MENETKGVIKQMADEGVPSEFIEDAEGFVLERENGKISLWQNPSSLDKVRFKRLTR